MLDRGGEGREEVDEDMKEQGARIGGRSSRITQQHGGAQDEEEEEGRTRPDQLRDVMYLCTIC
jgi:hypothetical protein